MQIVTVETSFIQGYMFLTNALLHNLKKSHADSESIGQKWMMCWVNWNDRWSFPLLPSYLMGLQNMYLLFETLGVLNINSIIIFRQLEYTRCWIAGTMIEVGIVPRSDVLHFLESGFISATIFNVYLFIQTHLFICQLSYHITQFLNCTKL